MASAPNSSDHPDTLDFPRLELLVDSLTSSTRRLPTTSERR